MSGRNWKPIQEIAIPKFRANCVSLLEEVRKTRIRIRITRRGKTIADIIPASSEEDERSWIGSMSGSIDIVGDIVSPVIDVKTVESLKN
jgi:prevent-host-death family protein